jgi:hypothetical protein
MLNVTNYPHYPTAEEAQFWGQMELDELNPPLTRDYAFDYINGRVFEAVWIDDEIPW